MSDSTSMSDAIAARLAGLSPERRALLEQKLRAPSAGAPAAGTANANARVAGHVTKRVGTGPALLTPAQELLWNLDQAVPGIVAYHVPRLLRIDGPVSAAALTSALNLVVARHEAVRTRFVNTPEGPRQMVAPASPVQFEELDLRKSTATDSTVASGTSAEHKIGAGNDVVNQVILERIRRPFDLANDLLLRATLIRTADAQYVLLIVTHHIVCDEWSRDVLFHEVSSAYNAFMSGNAPSLPDLPVQYADYSVWLADAMRRGALTSQLEYWRKELSGLATLDLPTDRPRTAVPGFAGARVRRSMSRGLLDDVRAMARQHDVTLNMALLAAFNVVLARHSGQTDIVVGSPVSSRRMPELEPLIGYFPNAVVLRTRLEDDPTFVTLLRRMRETSLAAYENQDVPLEQIALELRGSGQLGHEPLFNTWFVMQAEKSVALKLSDATVTTMATDYASAKFDILLGAIELPSGLDIVLEYRTDLFDSTSIERFGVHFETLLRSAVQTPNDPVSTLNLLPEAERALVVDTWNATAVEFPRNETLVSLLAAQVARAPDAIAVVDDSTSLTYAQLDRVTTNLALRLRERGAAPGSLVGVCADRSVAMVAALVAVIKAGAAYVPLDPAYPADRLAFMLEDAAAPVILAQRHVATTLPAHSASVIWLDDAVLADDEADGSTLLACAPSSSDLAYMIYTSGSTGRPKGALNEHGAIVNRLRWMQSVYALTDSDVVLQKTPFSFDVSVWEFFWPLMTGARLVMARPGGHRDTQYLAQIITQHGVTVCHFVPSMLRAFLADDGAAGCTSLRDVMASGEALTPDLVSHFGQKLPASRLHNLYGPTECAVDVSFWPCPTDGIEPVIVPIGRPIANTQLYVLDTHLQPTPVGVPGELFIGGVQVGRGYHNRPELTAERFVRDPFSTVAGARMYRTGDRARWRADGSIEYLGRLDFQVKVRGFRIELGEIENAILQHPGVIDAAVISHDDGQGDARLVGFVVPAPKDTALSEGEAVERWTEVFERTYTHAEETGDTVESGFNIAGWISSYDKRPIPAAEMRVWVQSTCDRILALKPQRVLEIGCGTGLLLFGVAPHVSHFHGLDISATAIDGIRQDPAFAAIADRVSLGEARADEISALQPRRFDVIVINSVVQYFPSAEYLVSVVEKALELLSPGGSIFIGDVRLQPMLEALHSSVALYEASTDTSIADLRARVQQRLWNESELVIDPALFTALRLHRPAITDVQVMIKRGAQANELNKFRADVVLRTGTIPGAAPDTMQTADSSVTMSGLRDRLRQNPVSLRVTDIEDARTARDMQIVKRLRLAAPQSTVRELRAGLDVRTQSLLSPEALATIDSAYEVELTWPASNTPGRFDATFTLKTADRREQVAEVPTYGSSVAPWSEYVHHAAPQALTLQEVTDLRNHLGAILPDYMIPSTYVRMEAMPLTPSGKIDRKALRPPTIERVSRRYVAPRSETERALSRMWAEILRLEQVGVDDDFLELGGHSLLAMRIVGRVRRELGATLGLDTLVRGTSLAQFAALVDAAASRVAAVEVEEEDEFALAPVSRTQFRRGTPSV